MAQSAFFERVAAALFGGGQSSLDDEADRQLIADTIEAVVDTVEPRVRLNARYRDKLEGCVRKTIAHLRAIAREPLEPVLLARAAWSDDPRLNAFFARADDVPACLGRSRELRAFFDNSANAQVQEAYALLGMKKEERSVFAPQLEGDTLKHDVAQVTVSFSEHRIIAPAVTLAATRLDIGKRIIQRLAQVALARIIALDTKATALQEHKAFLAARMRLLNLARDGMEGIVKDPATISGQMKAVERELKETVEDYIETKSSLATLDGYIGQIDDVFSNPDQHLTLTHTPVRISRMGFKVDDASTGPVNDLALAELSLGENLRGAIAIVRCPRSELPPKEDLVAQAERYL
ncbi:MAG TPA: hypothetical protein VJT81_10515 [Burkholderiales bacterium]|nr:hypothetical protein [Burkholderiales bacterium]